MIEIKAPNQYDLDRRTLFLAGSIEMGKADGWQQRIVEQLKNKQVQILNPRRDDWDSSWEQSINNPQFKEQVAWELEAIYDSDIIVMYFDPNTQSPITLLELGIIANIDDNITKVVYCPEGFWRKGNVDIVCEYHDIRQVNSEQELLDFLNSILVDKPKWDVEEEILAALSAEIPES